MQSRKGKFTASNISRLLAGGTGKTAASYVLECSLLELGIKEDITTAAMLHGINNQLSAFQQCIWPKYDGVIWFDEFIPYGEFAGASPDFILKDNFVGDIKCPAFIDTFLEQCEKVPIKYYQQVQMQMMSAKVDTGLLCVYLTKPEIWGEDIWEEYPMPLDDRHKIFEFATDNEIQDNINNAIKKYQPLKEQLTFALAAATEMDSVEYFYAQINGGKFRNIKDASNIFGAAENLIRVGNNFYYKMR